MLLVMGNQRCVMHDSHRGDENIQFSTEPTDASQFGRQFSIGFCTLYVKLDDRHCFDMFAKYCRIMFGSG